MCLWPENIILTCLRLAVEVAEAEVKALDQKVKSLDRLFRWCRASARTWPGRRSTKWSERPTWTATAASATKSSPPWWATRERLKSGSLNKSQELETKNSNPGGVVELQWQLLQGQGLKPVSILVSWNQIPVAWLWVCILQGKSIWPFDWETSSLLWPFLTCL